MAEEDLPSPALGSPAGRPVLGLSWLASPLPLAGLILMGLNDHWLRQTWPNPVTWKLSDLGVLLYLPALLCAGWGFLPRPWRPRPLSKQAVVLASLLSGAALAALNLSPSLAEAYGATLSAAFPGNYHYTADASDCVALIVVPVVALNGLRRVRAASEEGHPSSEGETLAKV